MQINSGEDYRNPTEMAPAWTSSVAGRFALEWEQAELDHLVGDVFGYHALQLGLPALDALRANRMPSRWLMCEEAQAVSPAVLGDFHALPFPASSLDLIVLPHTLEFARDPHLTLREVDRVLRPEGRLVVTGFNPASLWGMARRTRRMNPWRGPEGHPCEWVGYWRLRDWLRLLSFEVEGGRFGCYLPPVSTEAWRDRLRWMEPLGDRWWPVLGSVYAVMAVKRVRGMRLVGLSRSSSRAKAPAPAVVAQRHQRSWPPQSPGGGA